jgi:hypothetical protein
MTQLEERVCTVSGCGGKFVPMNGRQKRCPTHRLSRLVSTSTEVAQDLRISDAQKAFECLKSLPKEFREFFKERL